MAKKSKFIVAAVVAVVGLNSQAFAAGGGLGLNKEFGGVRAASGFDSSAFVSAPPPVFNTPAPVFNPSESYTVPQSPETPVSPASPGSVFGNG